MEAKIPIYLVDAFAEERFRGNPAAVCLLQGQYSDIILQNIAAEMNLSETAFLSMTGDKMLRDSKSFSLRWFTPKQEVPLCGHATLATATVLFYDINILSHEIIFETKSGKLTAKKGKKRVILDFPADDPVPIDPPKELLRATGITEYKNVVYARNGKKLLIHLKNQEKLRNLEPDFEGMIRAATKEDIRGVIVTSQGYPPYDFISRYFAPWVGIDEDPVTGAAHTVLTPYWSKILGKKEMMAFQASQRGGELIVQVGLSGRVNLIGNAVVVMKGELYL